MAKKNNEEVKYLKNTAKQIKATRELTKNIEDQERAREELTDGLVWHNQALDRNSGKIDENTKSITKQTDALADYSEGLTGNSEALGKHIGNVDKQRESVEKLTESVEKYLEALAKQEEAEKKAGETKEKGGDKTDDKKEKDSEESKTEGSDKEKETAKADASTDAKKSNNAQKELKKQVEEATASIDEQSEAFDRLSMILRSFGRMGIAVSTALGEDAGNARAYVDLLTSDNMMDALKDFQKFDIETNAALEEFFKDFEGNVKKLKKTDVVKAVKDLIESLPEGLQEFKEKLEDKGVSNDLTDALLDGVKTISDELPALQKAVEDMSDDLFNDILSAVAYIPKVDETVEEWMDSIFGKWNEATITGKWDLVGDTVNSLKDNIGNAATYLEKFGLNGEEVEYILNGMSYELDNFSDSYDKLSKVINTDSVQGLLGFIQSGIDKKADKNDWSKNWEREENKAQLGEDIESKNSDIDTKKSLGISTIDDDKELLRMKSELLKLELEATEKTSKEKYEIRKKFLEDELALAEDNAEQVQAIKDEQYELQKERDQEQVEGAITKAQAILDAMGTVDEILVAIENDKLAKKEADTEAEKQQLKDKLDNNLITQQEYDRKILKLDEDLEKEKIKTERKQAARQKALKAFQIGINTAAAIMGLWVSPGFPAAIPLAVTVGVLGLAQLAAVLATPLPKARKGGYIEGPSHANGGVLIEAEGGEGIVNRAAMSAFPGMVSLMNAIGLNGGRIPDGGYGARSAIREAGTVYSAAGGILSAGMEGEDLASTIREAMIDAVSRVKVYTAISDIHDGEKMFSQMEQYRQL